MEEVSKKITNEQKHALIQYMEEHAEFAHDRFVNSTGAKSLSEQWDLLAEKLNALGGACKNGEMWKRAWVNMRSKTKQKYQEYKNSMERSGINRAQEFKPTELDERIISLMSIEAVVGQEEVAEPLRVLGLVPDVLLMAEDDDLGPSCFIKTETQKTTTNRTEKKRKEKGTNMEILEIEREFLKEKRRKNDIAQQQVNALNSLKDVLVKILDTLPGSEIK